MKARRTGCIGRTDRRTNIGFGPVCPLRSRRFARRTATDWSGPVRFGPLSRSLTKGDLA